uniref:HLF transcription factor, PAR bZIP family member n=1 Tax=Oncorhynchus mykiss TaxID=8022 RepID=A0A8C7NPK8_ONCMY
MWVVQRSHTPCRSNLSINMIDIYIFKEKRTEKKMIGNTVKQISSKISSGQSLLPSISFAESVFKYLPGLTSLYIGVHKWIVNHLELHIQLVLCLLELASFDETRNCYFLRGYQFLGLNYNLGQALRPMEKMSRPDPLNSSFQPPTNGVLKSLLENPMKLPFHHEEGFGKDEKKLDEEGGANTPQSAFLGPTLWDKTLPYDGDNFQLEYMDLEEFLSENGIPANPAQNNLNQPQQSRQPTIQQVSPAPPIPSVVDLNSHATISVHTTMVSQNCLQSPPARAVLPSAARNTPSPIDPESIQVPVGYEPDPADLALSSVPGQEMFDPRKRKFAPEELKPQPMIKKARKIFIPEDLKDDKYWARRRKNNVAAKRSRDARRLKENQIAIRAGFLEKENGALRSECCFQRDSPPT